MLCIGGSGRLDKVAYYIDSDQGLIHMNRDGMHEYIRQIQKQCNYVLMQIEARYERRFLEQGLARLNRKCVEGRRNRERRDRQDRHHPYAR